MNDDERWMRRAIELAAKNVGLTGDNPSVGCVIVKDGVVVGEGVTAPGGRPHAEEQALRIAGAAARGATAYVTLEPCGERSSGAASCSQLLAAAGGGARRGRRGGFVAAGLGAGRPEVAEFGRRDRPWVVVGRGRRPLCRLPALSRGK